MPDLLTLEEAKSHVRAPGDQENDDIWGKVLAAQAIVLSHLTQRDETWAETMAAWTSETVPMPIKHAILVQLGELYRYRGDEYEETHRAPGGLSPCVEALLMPYKDPGIA